MRLLLMGLLCALTACSAEGSNNGSFKPIDFMIGNSEAELDAVEKATKESVD